MGSAMTSYYNEYEPYAAQWLKNLIAAGRIYEVLTNRAYIGEHYFNKYEKRGGAVRRMKPRQEWVPIKVDPIVGQELFLAVKEKLESRSPERVPPLAGWTNEKYS